ncbi:MAG: outer membrane protein assembly factor BamB family protein [Allosphingosinicella sp.]
MKRIVLLLAAAGLLSGCGLFGGERPTTPTVGERIPVLQSEGQIEVDPALAGIPVVVPAPQVNVAWAQSGGNAAKSMGHVALGDNIAQAWSVSIGQGSSATMRLAAEPVVADGRIYTVDTKSVARAFDAATGAPIWTTEVRGENSPRETLFGGGISFDSGRVYVANGAGDAAALDAATGAIVWTVKPGGPLRGAPTIGNDNIYVISQDSQVYALNAATGETRWTGSGAFEQAGVFGTATPAFSQSTVVAGFSSGELTAYRYENGQPVWQDALSRTGVSTVVGTISDIDADPVIDQGRVFAIGQGGRMVAVELITGQRAWEINIAGISTPWVAGDWLFVVNDQAQVLAIARSSGRVRWISQLPRYRDEEDRKGQIFWRGPVLAGNRLILTASNGNLAFVSPVDGTILSTTQLRTPISLPPIVANNTLYILADNGRLTAWR